MNFIAQLFLGLAFSFVAALLAPRPPRPEAGEVELPSIEQGRTAPRIWGSPWVFSPTIVFLGDLDSVEIEG